MINNSPSRRTRMLPDYWAPSLGSDSSAAKWGASICFGLSWDKPSHVSYIWHTVWVLPIVLQGGGGFRM
jgi:hypothetical protein